MKLTQRFQRRPDLSRLQSAIISGLVEVLVLLVLVVLVWAVIGVGLDVWDAITMRSVDAFKKLTIELLTVFIFIEIFHSLTEYLRSKRIRITTLVDASMAFILRELWVGMYGGEMEWQLLLALAVMVLALGAVRTLAVVYSPGERASDLADG